MDKIESFKEDIVIAINEIENLEMDIRNKGYVKWEIDAVISNLKTILTKDLSESEILRIEKNLGYID